MAIEEIEKYSLPDSVWDIGIYDAHCHPTDNYKRLPRGLQQMRASKLTIMATRLDDQEKVHEAASQFPDRIVPSFGYHPWFTHLLYTSQQAPTSKYDHYRAILFPEPPEEFLDLLPDPVSLESFITQLTTNVKRHPHALIGEVGIDRSFRLPKSGKQISFVESDSSSSSSDDDAKSEASSCCGEADQRILSPFRVTLEHQKEVLLAQLGVAAKFERPVSVHGVQAHGVLFQIFSELWAGVHIPSKKEKNREKKLLNEERTESSDNSPRPPPFPTRICLHSYSGPPDQISLWTNKRKIPAQVYFSFSIVINKRYGDKFNKVVQTVPDDRLLVESDFPVAGERMEWLHAEIVLRVCEIKGWGVEEGAKILKNNWHEFVYGHNDWN
ncbi:hypothetical protein BZA70DRAFT_183910 [Myxozyma melibiosi]|uniref:Metallo-dependent hydrolase n=1 Tax=Myxozyma melibiosi TaxID=54550 RepID=A0ABR1F4J6_9ASCO